MRATSCASPVCFKFGFQKRGVISVKPYSGFDAARAAKLAALLESSIQRRFPKGLKVHVHSVDRFGCLAALTSVLKIANLTITRANVRLP